MAGYWDKVVTGIFPVAQQLKEDWAARTVQFEMNEVTGGPTFTFEQLRNLSQRLGTTQIVISTRPDIRYVNDGGGGVYVVITLNSVKFPEAASS